ncbi:MAG: Holliday junction branch migration protein RuvA [Halanaerobiaceae bacterium]
MIGYLEGTVSWVSEESVIVNVDGVGYLLQIAGDLNLFSPGEKVSLYVYTYVREDSLRLYGFEKMEERELFSTLLSVSGIGPSAATNILAVLSYQRFVNAILTENLAVLQEVSGIGPKTARRLVLELQGRAEDLARSMQMDNIDQTAETDLYEALGNLGYSRQEIDGALSELNLDQELQLEEKIREVLSYLGRESFS